MENHYYLDKTHLFPYLRMQDECKMKPTCNRGTNINYKRKSRGENIFNAV